MLDLIASLVVDLSDQRLTVYEQNNQVVRVIAVSTGKPSTPTPIFESTVLTKYRSVTMRGRNYTVPGVPYTICISSNELICLHAAPWQESAGLAFGTPAAMVACECPWPRPAGCSRTLLREHPSASRPRAQLTGRSPG